MPQVRQHGLDYSSGRVGSDGRAAVTADHDARQGLSAEKRRCPLAKTGILLSVVGPPVARETASEKPAVQPPPVQLPTRVRRAAVAAPPASPPSATAACRAELPPWEPVACRGGRAGGLYAFRTAGSCCRGDIPVGADAIALGSRGRAGGFRSAGFGGGAGGLDGRVQSPTLRIRSPTTRMPKPSAAAPPPADAAPSRRCRRRSSIAVGCPSKPCC